MTSLILSLMLLLGGMQARGQGARGQEPATVQRAGTETVSGTVMQGETQRPFPYVRVELKPDDFGARLSGHEKPCNTSRDIRDNALRHLRTTDANGRFTFQNIPAGRYYLTAEHEGYLRAEYGQRGRWSRGMVLAIGPQETAATTQTSARGVSATVISRPGMPQSVLGDLVVRMFPAPTISGRVYNEQGERVPAAIVQAYQHRFAPLNGRSLKPVRSIFTDDNGEYRLFWLNPGQYVVSAAYSDYVLQPWSDSLRFTPNLPDGDNRYPVVFYNGVVRPSEAIPVSVGGIAAPPIDLALWKRERFNVRIRLDGKLQKDLTVVLVPTGGDLCAAMDFGIRPGKDGIVEVRDVPSGRYMVMAAHGREAYSELLPLDVDQDIRDFRLPVIPPQVVFGRVSYPAGISVEITLTRTGNNASHVISAIPDESGAFRFNGVGLGAYYVSVNSPPGFYADAISAQWLVPPDPSDHCSFPPGIVGVTSRSQYRYLDNHSHINRDSPYTLPGDADCLRVSVRSGGQLYGRVVDAAGMPVAGAQVVGLPRSVWATNTDSKVAFTPPDRYLTATTNWEGRFVLVGVVMGPFGTSGEYKLFAFEDLDFNEIYDPNFFGRFEDHDLISLEGGMPQGSLRTVSLQIGSNAVCTPEVLCVLKAIHAEETRGIQEGR